MPILPVKVVLPCLFIPASVSESKAAFIAKKPKNTIPQKTIKKKVAIPKICL